MMLLPASFKRVTAPLRAALAMALMLAVFLQQGSFASGLSHAEMADRHAAAQPATGHVHSAAAPSGHDDADATSKRHDGPASAGGAGDCHGCTAAKAADSGLDKQSCEVHCAPCPAVPVDAHLFVPARGQVLAEALPHAVTPGGPASEIRPPRS